MKTTPHNSLTGLVLTTEMDSGTEIARMYVQKNSLAAVAVGVLRELGYSPTLKEQLRENPDLAGFCRKLLEYEEEERVKETA